MSFDFRRYSRSQSGYTLVELIVASALGLAVMTGLTSVVLTTWRASVTATSRVEASSEIRNFQLSAYEDFARSAVPNPTGCGTQTTPCTTQPIVLAGTQVTNSTSPTPGALQVTYAWDGTTFLDRQAGANPARHTSPDVTRFTWYIDTTGPNPTVVVNLTVTIQSYSESQTFRFYPRLNP